MKFGKGFASQMVPEWQEKYMDYNNLKVMLKNIQPRNALLAGRFSKYEEFHGLVQQEGSEGQYQITLLSDSEDEEEYKRRFFETRDEEFEMVESFYQRKVDEVKVEAQELSEQMYALIALRIKVDNPSIDDSTLSPATVFPSHLGNHGGSHMVEIQEVEAEERDRRKMNRVAFRLAPLNILDSVSIIIHPETPVSTSSRVIKTSKLEFSKDELRKAEEKIQTALVEFYRKLRLLKSYCSLNVLAFSKIMKKHDKITSGKASKSYLDTVDKSCLGSSDEVSKLMERVEATFIKYFFNGNRKKGMGTLNPKAKRETHRGIFILGLFTGCSIALVAAIVVLRARIVLKHERRVQYMDSIFPLYSLFGFIVLHMLMYAANIYCWRRYRVNYPSIFGFKQGTELSYRQVLLLASGISVLALFATLWTLVPTTRNFGIFPELIPLILVFVLVLIIIFPLKIIYHSSRFFLITCAMHCLVPLYKVTLSDTFFADQLTSQVQAIRSLQFYVCYYGSGSFITRSNKFQESSVYKICYIIVEIIPFLARFIQCLRRSVEEKDSMQGFNGLKYFSTIVALVTRTLYDQKRGVFWKVMALSISAISTVFNFWWDIFIDWGLWQRKSRNPWLRDKLLLPNKIFYFVAIVLDFLLRLVWILPVLGLEGPPYLHNNTLAAVVASLEILRRGMWNFFRLENERVEKYRDFKSVPLPFNIDKEDDPEGFAFNDDPEGFAFNDDPEGFASDDDPEGFGKEKIE